MQRHVGVQRIAGAVRGPSAGRPGRQRGVYGVEFAGVFLAFFLLFYGVLSWGLIITARQSLQLAAEDAARASLRYRPAGNAVSDQLQARVAAACEQASRASQWIGSLSGAPTRCSATIAGAGLCANAGPCCQQLSGGVVSSGSCATPARGWTVTVRVSYDDYRRHPLVPVLPGLQLVLPTQLAAQATAWVSPTMLDRGG